MGQFPHQLEVCVQGKCTHLNAFHLRPSGLVYTVKKDQLLLMLASAHHLQFIIPEFEVSYCYSSRYCMS